MFGNVHRLEEKFFMYVLVHFKSRDNNLLKALSLILAIEGFSKEKLISFLN